MLCFVKKITALLVIFAVFPAYAESKYQGSSNDPVIESLVKSGSHEDKLDVVIIGDGFSDSSEDQEKFDAAVAEIQEEILKKGIYAEVIGALNIYKVNTFSVDSGVSEATVDKNGNLQFSTINNTTLNITPNRDWNSCWFTWDREGMDRFRKIEKDLFPFRDRVWVIVNSKTSGGCNYGGINTSVTTLSSGYIDVLRHESGHNIVSLCDEYDGAVNNSSAGRCPNLTSLNENKWDEFVDSKKVSLPTGFDSTQMSATETAGKFPFPGGNQDDVYRSVFNSTMRHNTKKFGPANEKLIRSQLGAYWDYDFGNTLALDFSGDGLDDLVVHSDRVLYLYISNGSQFEFHSSIAGVVEGSNSSWELRPGDEIYKADFNGDLKGDLMIVNRNDWVIPYLSILLSTGDGFEVKTRYDENLPGWDSIQKSDEFIVADYTGDGKDDLLVMNTKDWAVGYLLMLKSNGNSLNLTRRYDDVLPGWGSMEALDEIQVADFNGDGKEEFIIRNFGDWNKGYLGIIESNGESLSMKKRYDGELPNWGKIARHDDLKVLDFSGDGQADVVIKNCQDWNRCYFGAFESNVGTLKNAVVSIESVPGWEFGINDVLQKADINGDGKDDLYLYNPSDWDKEYLGVILSGGDGSFKGGWLKDRIGQWNLGSEDEFIIADFAGESEWDDLIVYNKNWLGTLRSTASGVTETSINNKWVTDVEFHDRDWW